MNETVSQTQNAKPWEPTQQDIMDCARIWYAANRTARLIKGDTSEPPWKDLSPLERHEIANGVYLCLRNPDAWRPEQEYDAWVAQKLREGWKYGPEKDVDAKNSPSLVPYHELPELVKLRAEICIGICRAFWKVGNERQGAAT